MALLCVWPLLTGDTRGTALRVMTDTEAKVRLAEWAEIGRRWEHIPKEERLALPPRITIPIRAEMQAYQEKRERKNRASEARRIGRLEEEAWAEYAELERQAKLARAIRKLRTRQ
jgi:hypothetical protein